MYVIAVDKSQEILLNVRRLFIFFSTTTQAIRLRRRVDVFFLDDVVHYRDNYELHCNKHLLNDGRLHSVNRLQTTCISNTFLAIYFLAYTILAVRALLHVFILASCRTHVSPRLAQIIGRCLSYISLPGCRRRTAHRVDTYQMTQSLRPKSSVRPHAERKLRPMVKFCPDD